MSEKPILFSGPMVRAILDGRKTMTRRVMKFNAKQCKDWGITGSADAYDVTPHSDGKAWGFLVAGDMGYADVKCPYGGPGDRLWVREAFRYWFQEDVLMDCIDYAAGGAPMKPEGLDFDTGMRFSERCAADSKFRPSIHMPRWASRLTLEVTTVRVERLQDISEADARAEGCPVECQEGNAVDWFSGLWDGINAKCGYGWDSNPWVWVIEFKTTTKEMR